MKILHQHPLLSPTRLRACLATGTQAVCMGVLSAILGVCTTTPASADLINSKAVTSFQPLSGVSVAGQSMDLNWEPVNWDSSFMTRDFLRSSSNPLGETDPETASELTLLSHDPAIAFHRD